MLTSTPPCPMPISSPASAFAATDGQMPNSRQPAPSRASPAAAMACRPARRTRNPVAKAERKKPADTAASTTPEPA